MEENRPILGIIRQWMEEFQVPAYDEKDGSGLLRHVLIRYGFTTKEIMVCLIINGGRLPEQEALIERLRGIEGMTSISINVNRERTNVILGKETKCIWGMPYITDYIHLRSCGGEKSVVCNGAAVQAEESSDEVSTEEFALTDTAIAYHISPQSFYQVNPVQTEKLYSMALEYAGLTGTESVWDLYCGIGTISLFLSQKAKQVYGVEIVPQAIEDARSNAKLNGITNAEFFVGKAEEVLPEFYEESDSVSSMRHPDVIVVDPPRKGCDGVCLSTMLQMRPDRIVYVSCDSATLARDLRVLVDGGYELRRVRAFDQFGNTTHVETVVLLSTKKTKRHIDIEITTDELDLTCAEAKATYEQIKAYVKENFGLNVSNLYIAQVKREFGIVERINYNVGAEGHKVPQVTEEKRKAIIDALKHFKMI